VRTVPVSIRNGNTRYITASDGAVKRGYSLGKDTGVDQNLECSEGVISWCLVTGTVLIDVRF